MNNHLYIPKTVLTFLHFFLVYFSLFFYWNIVTDTTMNIITKFRILTTDPECFSFSSWHIGSSLDLHPALQSWCHSQTTYIQSHWQTTGSVTFFHQWQDQQKYNLLYYGITPLKYNKVFNKQTRSASPLFLLCKMWAQKCIFLQVNEDKNKILPSLYKIILYINKVQRYSLPDTCIYSH